MLSVQPKETFEECLLDYTYLFFIALTLMWLKLPYSFQEIISEEFSKTGLPLHT